MTGLRISVLLLAFLAAALAVFPLRFAWAAAGSPADLHVQGFRGTVWSGQLSGVTWRGIALGNLSITSSAFDRVGDLVLTVRSGDGPLTSAAIPLSSRGNVIDGIAASMDLAALFSGAPANKRLLLTDGSLTLKGERCISARGKIATDAIPAQGVPAFDGRLECRQGQVYATAVSADGLHSLTIRLEMTEHDGHPSVIQASAATQIWLASLGIPVGPPEARK